MLTACCSPGAGCTERLRSQWHTPAEPHAHCPTASINNSVFPAQLLHCLSSQPWGRGHSPMAASQGWREGAEKVLSFLLQTQSRSSVSASHRSHCSEPRLGAHTHCSACSPRQPSGPCTAPRPAEMPRGLSFHCKDLGNVNSANNRANPGASPRGWGDGSLPPPTGKEGSSQGHGGTRGHGKSSHSHCSPRTHRWRPRELPASPSATKQPHHLSPREKEIR